MKFKAAYYKKHGEEKVRCELCPHNCIILPDQVGICSVRQNLEGELYSLNYSEITSMALDPIEKKPLFHFFPGSNILSIGTFGCNFKCPFCQNWQISQERASSKTTTPEELIEIAKSEKSFGIAYTYSEPNVWFEYVLASAKLAHENNLKNIMVTNGFINPEPFEELGQYIDAMNIDLKGYSDEFYKEFPKGKLQPVLDTISAAFKRGIHIEVTNLIIPGLNDSKENLTELVDFIASVSKDIPLHFSRYFPHYKMKKDPTPEKTLFLAKEIADKKLKYVYLGNIWSDSGSETICPECGALVISRKGYYVELKDFKKGYCANCGYKLNFVV